MIKKIFSEAALIILVAVIFSLAVNGLRADGLRLFKDNTQNSTETQGVKEISIEDAMQKFNENNVLFVDARSQDDYEAGHIKGAINLPDHEFDNWIDDFLSKTEPQTQIITYCDGVHCELGKDLAEKLYFAGFENVFYIVNGWSRWTEQSMPVE